MGIREKLNQSPSIAVLVVAVVLIASVLMIAFRITQDSGTGPAKQAYFTIDDGKTWFPDDNAKLSPFIKDGKPAHRVFVWTSDGGKTKFVSHLERYTEEARQKVEQALAQKQAFDPGLRQLLISSGIEVKAPGESQWVKLGSPQGAKVATPQSPDGKSGSIEPVVP